MCPDVSQNTFLCNFSTPKILRSSEISAHMGTFFKIQNGPSKKSQKVRRRNFANFRLKSTYVEMLLKLDEVGQKVTLGAEISDRNFCMARNPVGKVRKN